jgi:signal peptidase II
MNANRLTRLGVLVVVLVSAIGCDQVTKHIATQTLAPLSPERHRQSFLGDTLRLEYALNPGAFLGMGGELKPGLRFWSLTILNGALLVVLGYVLISRWDMARGPFAAWALILAGGIGNLIDRVSQKGLVTDFLNLGIGPDFRTGIFNVADMAITAGFALFIFCWWREADTKRGLAGAGTKGSPGL